MTVSRRTMLKTLGLVPIAPLSLVSIEASEVKNPIVVFEKHDDFLAWGEKTLKRRDVRFDRVGIRRMICGINKQAVKFYDQFYKSYPENLDKHLTCEFDIIQYQRYRFRYAMDEYLSELKSRGAFVSVNTNIYSLSWYQGFVYEIVFLREIRQKSYLTTMTLEWDWLDFESDEDFRYDSTTVKVPEDETLHSVLEAIDGWYDMG
jgi:hypothetical protein